MSVFRNDILDGRVALVTGGGSGICKGIARALMAHGASTVIVGRKADQLEAAAEELADETGKKCVAAPGDVRDTAAVERVVDTAMAELGRVDILVNGAAGNFLCPASQLSYNGFRTVIEIDTIGTFNFSRACFEHCFTDEKGGNIINISATLHYGATPLQSHAAAAKAAVDSLTRSMALEWGSAGIRVNGIAPGPIDETEGISRLVPPDLKKKLEAGIPLGRFGRIDEIANVAVFLASEASSLITGATIVADGGAWLAGRGIGME